MIAPRMTDRYVLEIGKEVKLTFKPLSSAQKAEGMVYIGMESGNVLEDRIQMLSKILKFSLTKVEGIQYYDGDDFDLTFDDNGQAEQTCIDELCNIQHFDKLIFASFNLITGIKERLYNPFTLENVEGAKFILPKKKASPKKQKA